MRGCGARSACLAVVLAVVMGSAAGGCSNRLFLHPTRDPIPTAARRVEIPGTRGRIRGSTIEAFYEEHDTHGRRPLVYVLAFTGNAGRAEYRLETFPALLRPWYDAQGSLGPDAQGRQGIGVLAVNYPGFGGSSGPATLRRLGAAALDAYAYLVKKADGAPIVVYGISMGTTAALHVAASETAVPPVGLVLDRGPDIPGLVMGRFGWWNLWLLAGPVALSLPRSARSVRNARRIEGVPALLVLGTRDRLVRPRNGQRVAEHYAGPARVVWLDIGHYDALDERSEPALDEGLRWLQAQIGLPPS